MKLKNEGNMYLDSVYQWNVFKGCRFDCIYCKPSFQRQSKRQRWRCEKCYTYEPHLHEERLAPEYIKRYFPKKTEGDEFIWACSSGDVYFMKDDAWKKILDVIRKCKHLNFFMQSKSPCCFFGKDIPNNLIIGTTIETNRAISKISKAPSPLIRKNQILELKKEHGIDRMNITIEPIIDFDFNILFSWMLELEPERIYIGYNSKPKEVKLDEPSLQKTIYFIESLEEIGLKVKTKLLRERDDHG